MSTQRIKKGETPRPLKEEKARIRAQSGLVSFCQQGDWCKRWERARVYISRKCIASQTPVFRSCWHTQEHPKKVPSAFQEGRNLLEKAEVETNQANFPKASFKGEVLSAKAGVYFETCPHGDFLCYGNNFDMDYADLHSCVTWPKDGKGKVSWGEQVLRN